MDNAITMYIISPIKVWTSLVDRSLTLISLSHSCSIRISPFFSQEQICAIAPVHLNLLPVFQQWLNISFFPFPLFRVPFLIYSSWSHPGFLLLPCIFWGCGRWNASNELQWMPAIVHTFTFTFYFNWTYNSRRKKLICTKRTANNEDQRSEGQSEIKVTADKSVSEKMVDEVLEGEALWICISLSWLEGVVWQKKIWLAHADWGRFADESVRGKVGPECRAGIYEYSSIWLSCRARHKSSRQRAIPMPFPYHVAQ